MKLLHLADLHLGRRLYEYDLGEDQAHLLDTICTLCTRQGVDAVLLAGDLYDKSVPGTEAVSLLDSFLTRLAGLHIPVFAIAGNHDSPERLDFGSKLLAAGGLHIAGCYTGTLPCIRLEDEYGPVDIRLLPFVKAATVRHCLPDADTSSYDKALEAALAVDPPDPALRNVLVAHQFVTAGADAPAQAGSESTVSVGTVDNVDAARFAAFDYVALGHIHRAQGVGRPTLRYAGSPLVYSLAEVGQEKTATLVTLRQKGDVEITPLPLVPLRQLRHLTGPLAALTDPARVTDPEDYIWATLTDETPVLDAMARMKAVYPRTLTLSYDNSITRAAGQAVARQVRQKTFAELFGEFYEGLCGRAPDAEEWAVVQDTMAAIREKEER